MQKKKKFPKKKKRNSCRTHLEVVSHPSAQREKHGVEVRVRKRVVVGGGAPAEYFAATNSIVRKT
jgi:hypothetical protein